MYRRRDLLSYFLLVVLAGSLVSVQGSSIEQGKKVIPQGVTLQLNSIAELTPETATCLAGKGVVSVMPQIVYISSDASMNRIAELDKNTCQTLATAEAAGMTKTDVSLSVCPICKGSTYMDQLKESLDLLVNGCGKTNGGTLWLTLADNLWLPNNFDTNRMILDNLLFFCANARDGNSQFICGIISSKPTWQMLFGVDSTYSPIGAPLIYQSLDDKPNMNDWTNSEDGNGAQKFGSWETPFGKQYKQFHIDDQTCKMATGTYANFVPSWL